MNSEPLVRSIIVSMMLLENSSETDVNPDVAVAGMESIVGELSMLEERDRLEFMRILAGIQDAEGESAVGVFARSLPFMIGFDAGE